MIRTKLMALAIAAVALAACGKDSDSTGPAPAAETGTITLLNESSTEVISVNIPSCEDPDWGANRLDGSETIAPGAERSWTVETGCYDLKASNGSKAAYWYDIQVGAGGNVQIPVPAALDPNLVATGDLGSDLRAE